MNLFKQPSITEWLFGVVIIITPSIAGLIVYLPLHFLTGETQQSTVDFAIGRRLGWSRRRAGHRVSLESLFRSSGDPKIIQAEPTGSTQCPRLTIRVSQRLEPVLVFGECPWPGVAAQRSSSQDKCSRTQ